jgi:hypothetical protein
MSALLGPFLPHSWLFGNSRYLFFVLFILCCLELAST